MAAQAYQESRFDPQAQSFAGARGLMQVLPRTAEQLGFEQAFRQGGAVEFHQRLIPPRRQVVQTGRDQFLAGAPFADHQHGLFQLRSPGDVFQH